MTAPLPRFLIHRSERVTALLLTPGASAKRDSPALVAIERALVPDGVVVERVDLPGTRVERAAAVVTEAAAGLADRAGVPLSEVYVGGRSFGGRACSLAVADGLAVAGLVLLSYPLHPPGRPAELRTAHFPKLTVPCLFVSGTKDTFGTPAELEAATAAIPGSVTHVWVDGGNHGMRGKDAPVAAAVRDWLASTATRPGRRKARPRR